MEGYEPEKINTEEARLNDKLTVLLSKDSTEEQIARVKEEMVVNRQLREYADKWLPHILLEEYGAWNVTLNQTSEEIQETLKPGETEEEERERQSMSEHNIRLLFGLIGDKSEGEVKAVFEEKFDRAVGRNSEATEPEIKSGSWAEYKNLRNIVDYMHGKAGKGTQNEIHDRMMQDKNFREFIDKIKKALGK